jgi:hypothetical protein
MSDTDNFTMPYTTATIAGEVAVAAFREPEWNGVALRLRVRDGGRAWMAQPLVLAPHEPGQFSQPFVRLDMGHAQMLIDELWRCGLRPTEGTGSAGALAATQAHLKDMQQLLAQVLPKALEA